ncbi:hypothetical protein V9T40_005472 [Parthenolecanium corni]|uniref:Alkyl transferase n=1 Tax=Parthenolecanium corni TaxID=536013 RepID=A0AAN9TEQ3_9HEMI
MSALATHSRKLMSMSSMSSSAGTSWIFDKPLWWVHRMCFYVLKWGSMPKHIAFIMDGNRRYAKKLGADRVAGHQRGFSKLTETLQWCLDLNVLEVTVFAFSIENFKRSEDEVDTLMYLAREKFRNLIEEWQKLREHGICVRVIGNLTLLPKDLITLIMIAMLLTKDNKRAFLNIAFSYTSREEMCTTSSQIVYGFRNGSMCESEITENIFDRCLYTYCSPVPELMVRTSGEHRLSDFLMWQGSFSYIHFVNVLWPEFSPWNLMSAVFCYQHFVNKLAKPFYKELPSVTENLSHCVNILHEERLRILHDMCCSNGQSMNWQKLNSISCDDLYDYYKTNFKA